MNFDLQHFVDGMPSITPSGYRASINGSGVDLLGYTGALAVAVVGRWITTAGSMAIALQESDDNSTFTAVATTDKIGSSIVVSGYINQCWFQGYKGTSRYLRAAGTLTGQTTGTPLSCGVIVIRGPKRHGPSNP